MRILLYESIPDITRSRFLRRLRQHLRTKGHEVYCLLDERVYCRLQGGQGDYGVINCSGPMTHNLVWGNRDSCFVFRPDSEDLAQIQSLRRREFYKECLSSLSPDRIVVWNGLSTHHMDFQEALDEMGLKEKLFFQELGWLPQKDYFYCDQVGVNGASSIAKDECSAALTPEEKEALEKFLLNYRTTLRVDFGRVILVPLQIETDSNIIHFSPYKKNQYFISMLEKWLPEGYEVLIRPHPLSVSELLHWDRDDFILDNNQSIHDSLAIAQYVVGINSTVLIEGMAYGARVMAFGRGVFSALKRVCVSEEDCFEQVSAMPVDYDTFLYKLIFEKQISTHSMAGVENALCLKRALTKSLIDNSEAGRYDFISLLIGEFRYWGGIAAKTFGFLG